MSNNRKCKYCLNEDCILFSVSNEADVDFSVEDFTHTFYYNRGQTLFQEGAPRFGYFVLCRGAVKLSRTLQSGRKVVVDILGPGDILGLGEMRQDCFAFQAEALDNTEVGFIQSKDFGQLLKRYPSFATALIERLSAEVSNLHEQLSSVAHYGAASKLASLLVQLARTHGHKVDEDLEIAIHLKQEELAEMLGLSRETVSLTLNRFREKGWISYENNQFIIHSCAALEAE